MATSNYFVTLCSLPGQKKPTHKAIGKRGDRQRFLLGFLQEWGQRGVVNLAISQLLLDHRGTACQGAIVHFQVKLNCPDVLDLDWVEQIDDRLDPLFMTRFETGIYPDDSIV